MLSLDALAHWESAVLASIRGATGTIDERDVQITRSGMYAEYPAIFNAYTEARDESPDALLERYKRAIFLIWCSFTQLPVDSGIAELPETRVREEMHSLGALIESGALDEEFRLMLAWYRGHFGYMFDHFGGVRGLDDLIGGLSPDEARTELRRLRAPGDFVGRGQLGDYWRTIIAG
jgi:hypothetical protein